MADQVAPATYYTRYGNSNTKQVKILLAGLEGAEAARAEFCRRKSPLI